MLNKKIKSKLLIHRNQYYNLSFRLFIQACQLTARVCFLNTKHMNVHTLEAKTIKVLKYEFKVFITEVAPKNRFSPNNPGKFDFLLTLLSGSLSNRLAIKSP